jgi:osmotically-inducible protein OsmY
MVSIQRILRSAVCVALLATAFGCASTGKHESTGQYVDDSVITTKVKAAIFKEDTLKTLQINVKTYNGTVQLSGFVDSSRSVTKAGEVARAVENVAAVQNDLIVK